MANPLKSHFLIQKTNHSPPEPYPIMRSTKFFLKSILCALLLFSLPLFPSQAPEFMADTALTKFWELLRLLFIGIAVSYGLFSRRSATGPIESNTEPLGSQSSNFLSIFDELYDEKSTRVHTWRSSISQGESAFGVSTDEKLRPDSFDSENVVEIPGPDSEKNTVQSWNSQYFQCQPMIVVAKPNPSLGDEHERPLGLPIRSLRSIIADLTRPKPRARSGSSSRSNSMDSMQSLDRESGKNVNFVDLGPLNREQKFDETVPLPSPVPWRLREDLSAIKQPLHSRHLSVEESQFRNNKSFRSNSNASLSSNQSTVTSCSQNGVFELPELKVGKEKLDQSASVDSLFEFNADFHEKDLWAKFSGREEFNSIKNGLNGHQYSKSLSDFGNGAEKVDELEGEVLTNGDRSSKGDSNGLAWIGRRQDSSQKHKASILRGKSVRTFGQRAEAKRTEQTRESSNLTDDLVRDNHAHDSRTKQDPAKSCSAPRQSFCNENFEAEAVDCISDAGSEAYEVDKKAGEFIAKFREQIRLQKTGSIDGSAICG